MTNIAMEAMAHRNRWFTDLNSMVIFHGKLLKNQMVYTINNKTSQIRDFDQETW